MGCGRPPSSPASRSVRYPRPYTFFPRMILAPGPSIARCASSCAEMAARSMPGERTVAYAHSGEGCVWGLSMTWICAVRVQTLPPKVRTMSQASFLALYSFEFCSFSS